MEEKMNQIVLSKNSSSDELKIYFSKILELARGGKDYPVNLDEVWPLVYSRRDKAISSLKNNFMEGVDYVAENQSLPLSVERTGGQNRMNYYLTTSCLEYFIARKVRAVFDVYRTVFHKVANNVIERELSRKDLALMVLQAEEEKERLMLENKQQTETIQQQNIQIAAMSEEIVEMKQKTDYLEIILSSVGSVTTTQIAQDYGMSAVTFNKQLEAMRIQRKVNGQWILYAPYISEGYIISKTINITRSDGRPDTVMHTEWRQKGRLFLYNKLKDVGILPLIERQTKALFTDDEQTGQ